MKNKKFAIFLVVLLGLIFSISFFLTSSPIQHVPLSIFNILRRIRGEKPLTIETDVISALNKLKDSNSILIEVTENETCYWIKPTRNKTHYLLEINKYKSTMGRCLGFLRGKSYVIVDKGINMIGGNSCICTDETYLLEWKKDGIKITMR